MQVEDAWKGTEFIVFAHRDSKDVFILGSTDDIQVTLDDSIVSCQGAKCSTLPRVTPSVCAFDAPSSVLCQVNISTIAGSRHVGPIKSRVDDWERQLALFSETLVSLLMLLASCSCDLPREFRYLLVVYCEIIACRMSGLTAKGTGSIWRASLVLRTSSANFLMRRRCSHRWTSRGRKS